MTLDISNFYLMTLLKRPEYIRVKLSAIPQEIIDEYKLYDKATPDGSIHTEANKGMYRLPQASLLANEMLENVSMKMDTDKANWYQVPGNTTGAQSNSHWSWTTLE